MKSKFLFTILAFSSCILGSCNQVEQPTVNPTSEPTTIPTLEPTVEPTKNPTTESTSNKYELVTELLDILNNSWYSDIYYGPDYDSDLLINQFIGALSTSEETFLDPYTYLTKNQTTGGVSGQQPGKIGITLKNYYSYPVITDVDPLGAAYGILQPGDIVLETGKNVNGKLQVYKITDTNYDFTSLFSAALGLVGEKVHIKVARFIDGKLNYLTYEITLKKAPPTVYAKKVDNDFKDTLMVKWDSFVSSSNTTDTAEELNTILSKDNSKNIVIDLRDNGGGSLTAAIDIVDLFLPENQLVTTLEYKGGILEKYYTKTADFYDYEKIIILQNDNTASASEIFISAMLHYLPEKVYLVGTESYGKGIAQLKKSVLNGEYTLQYTCAKWLRPDNTWIGMTDSYYDTDEYELGFDPSENGFIDYDELLLFMQYYSSGIDFKVDDNFIAYKVDYVATSNAYFFTVFNKMFGTNCRTDYYFDYVCKSTLKQYQEYKNIDNPSGLMNLDTYVHFINDFYQRQMEYENVYHERIEYFLK